jgi:hypothetical protein
MVFEIAMGCVYCSSLIHKQYPGNPRCARGSLVQSYLNGRFGLCVDSLTLSLTTLPIASQKVYAPTAITLAAGN